MSKKEKIIPVRVSEEQYRSIVEFAGKENISVSEYVRRRVLWQPPKNLYKQSKKYDEPFALTHNALKEVNATPADYEMLGMRVDSMGMAWIIDGKNGFIWHNGATGNYNSYVGFCHGTQTAVVVLSNLSPNYRIPATVIGVKLLEEAQHSDFSE